MNLFIVSLIACAAAIMLYRAVGSSSLIHNYFYKPSILRHIQNLTSHDEKNKLETIASLKKIFSQNTLNVIFFRDRGGIKLLLACLEDKSDEVKFGAIHVLCDLSRYHNDNRKSIIIEGGTGRLVQMLEDDSLDVIEKATTIIENLIAFDGIMNDIHQGLDAAQMLVLVKSDSHMLSQHGAFMLGDVVANKDGTHTEESTDAIKLLMNLIKSGPDMLRLIAAQIIANAAANENCARAMDKEGAIEPLVGLVKTASASLRPHVVLALYNISAHKGPAVTVIQKDGIQILVGLLDDESADVRASAAGALSNLASGNPGNQCAIKDEGGIKLLVGLLNDQSAETIAHAASALSNMARSEDAALTIRDEGGIDALASLLQHVSEHVRSNVAGAVMNLAAIQSLSKKMIDAGVINLLVVLFKDQSEEVRIYALKAAFNLANNPDAARVIQDIGSHLLIEFRHDRSTEVNQWSSRLLEQIKTNYPDQVKQVAISAQSLFAQTPVSPPITPSTDDLSIDLQSGISSPQYGLHGID